jgi:hypothetical protein
MWQRIRRTGALLSAFALALPALAQYETIVIKHPIRAQRLAGIVEDSTGAPIAGVAVEDRDSAFKSVLASTKTDANGHFAFPGAAHGKTHYLHLQSLGFDPLEITVKLHHVGGRSELRVELHVAS